MHECDYIRHRSWYITSGHFRYMGTIKARGLASEPAFDNNFIPVPESPCYNYIDVLRADPHPNFLAPKYRLIPIFTGFSQNSFFRSGYKVFDLDSDSLSLAGRSRNA
jgi:hypothetical protein